MSNHESNYEPSPGLGKWFDDRLPVMRVVHGQLIDFPTPRNLNYLWTLGGILTFCLVAQIVSGVVLAMHYIPSDADAFNSVDNIRRNVNYGWLIQPMHAVGASMFFLAVFLHMFRGLYYGSYKAPREILWILGVLLFVLMIATAFLGYSLVWGQMSFWAVTVITNLFTAIPVVGEDITRWVLGDFAVSGVTLNRFYSLHYLLPFMITGVVGLHIWALHVVGQNNPTGVEIQSAADSVPMSPYAVSKDAFALALFAVIFSWFVFFAPDMLGHPDNFIPANPLSTPPHIVPEWYFLPFYAILRAVPDKLGGVVLMMAAIGVLFLIPWLDTSKVKSAKYRPVYKWFFWLFVISCLGLGYLGGKPPEGTYIVWAQIFTVYYFVFFLVVMPLLGVIETPSSLPGSISESVLDKKKPSGGGVRMPGAATATPINR